MITSFLDGEQIDLSSDSTFKSGRIGFWHPKEKWFLIDNVKVSADRVLFTDEFSGDLDSWDFARTLSYIADGAKRDRLVWSGDLDWAARNVYYAFSNASYMRESLKMLAFNQTPEGYIQASPYPENSVPPESGDYGQFPSDEFSAWFIPVAWDYLLYTGDIDSLRQIYPAIIKDINYLLAYIGDDGLFYQRLVTSKHASNLSLGDSGQRSYVNILIQDSLKKTALIADALGKGEDAALYSRKAEVMKDAVFKHLWNENGGYFQESKSNSAFYLVSNALAMSTRLISPEQAANLQDRMVRHFHGKFQSLMIRGKFEYNYGSAAFADFFAHGWTWLLQNKEVPLTVTECMSAMQGGWGDDSHPDTALAHIFSGYILGVQPETPGFASFIVKPQLTGSVTWAKGIVPTPKGSIVSSWRLEPKQFVIQLYSPDKTKAAIALPIAGLEDYRVTVNGKSTQKQIQGVRGTESDESFFYLRDLTPGLYTCVVDVLKGSYVTGPEPVVAIAAKDNNMKWNIKASSSHEQGGWGLDKLIDGTTTSEPDTKGYTSKGNDSSDSREWIEIDLTMKKTIKKFLLYPRTDTKTAAAMTAGFPVNLTVSIKNSHGNYQVIKNIADIQNPDGKAYEIDLYTVVGFYESQFIRLDVSTLGIPAVDEPAVYRLQLAEMEVVFDQ